MAKKPPAGKSLLVGKLPDGRLVIGVEDDETPPFMVHWPSAAETEAEAALEARWLAETGDTRGAAKLAALTELVAVANADERRRAKRQRSEAGKSPKKSRVLSLLALRFVREYPGESSRALWLHLPDGEELENELLIIDGGEEFLVYRRGNEGEEKLAVLRQRNGAVVKAVRFDTWRRYVGEARRKMRRTKKRGRVAAQ